MSDITIRFSDLTKPEPKAIGMGGNGGLEGAERLSRETALWRPQVLSADRIINTVKEVADARGRDTQRNDGYISGVTSIHKDSVVGSQFRLSAQPNGEGLKAITNNKAFADDAWIEEFQQVVEARFSLMAESNECWLDAARRNTFTGMLRLAIGVFLATGEVISTCEWIRESARPYKTALQMIRSDRLCNPLGRMDTRYLRRGIQMDERGKPISYFFRRGERFELYPDDFSYTWVEVAAAKPWGRKQVIHIIEQHDHDQSRGVADIVSALKNIRMTKRFREITLQNAVINATYAAAIESELPPEAITAAMSNGADAQQGMMDAYGGYMGALQSYLAGSSNLAIDGAVMPHLFPGTKLTMKNAGTPGGVGTNFEDSLLRYTASALGVSYESLSRDFSKTNYSSGRLAMNVQGASMAARKRHVADRFASDIYALLLEEMIANGDVPLPTGVRRDVFYRPLAKEAFTKCSWIGSGSGQVDELKETQASILKIRAGLSTHQEENAKLGYDWREVAKQRAREIKLFAEVGFTPGYDALRPQDKLAQPQPDNPTDPQNPASATPPPGEGGSNN